MLRLTPSLPTDSTQPLTTGVPLGPGGAPPPPPLLRVGFGVTVGAMAVSVAGGGSVVLVLLDVILGGMGEAVIVGVGVSIGTDVEVAVGVSVGGCCSKREAGGAYSPKFKTPSTVMSKALPTMDRFDRCINSARSFASCQRRARGVARKKAAPRVIAHNCTKMALTMQSRSSCAIRPCNARGMS